MESVDSNSLNSDLDSCETDASDLYSQKSKDELHELENKLAELLYDAKIYLTQLEQHGRKLSINPVDLVIISSIPSSPKRKVLRKKRVRQSDSDDSSCSTIISSKKVAARAASPIINSDFPPLRTPNTSTSDVPKVPITPVTQQQPSKPTPTAPPMQQDNPPPATKKPTPIVLRDTRLWTSIAQRFRDQKIKIQYAKSTSLGIRIIPETIADHRSITNYFRNQKISFHTFLLPEERDLNIVIKGMETDVEIPTIVDDLTSQGYEVKEIHRLFKNGKPLPVVKVRIPRHQSSIYKLNTVADLRVRIEHQKPGTGTRQCHNCQQFGHSASSCFAPARCVKCDKHHGTKDCVKGKNTPATCINCGGPHTANHLLCPKNPNNPENRPSSSKDQPLNARKPSGFRSSNPEQSSYASVTKTNMPPTQSQSSSNQSGPPLIPPPFSPDFQKLILEQVTAQVSTLVATMFAKLAAIPTLAPSNV